MTQEMGKIRTYTFVSADGFYAGPNGEIDWFTGERKDVDDLKDYSHQRRDARNILIFGRTTYEMMRGYWSTSDAMEDDPETTLIMRESPKIVFSKTLDKEIDTPTWSHVTVMDSVDPDHLRRLQKDSGRDMTILGSGIIVRQFADLGLIDDFQLMVVPVILSTGKLLLSELEFSNMVLTDSKTFKNGISSRSYSPSV